MVRAFLLGAGLVLGGCVATLDRQPESVEGGSHACELKPVSMSHREVLLSGVTLHDVELPEIPFLPILRYAARPAGETPDVTWRSLPGANAADGLELCGYINLARAGEGVAEGQFVTQTGLRARRDIAYDPAALAFLFDAFEAEQFMEIPPGRYVAVEAPDGAAVTVAEALEAAARLGHVDPERWAITLTRQVVYVPLREGGGPVASMAPPRRGSPPARHHDAAPEAAVMAAAKPEPGPARPVQVAEAVPDPVQDFGPGRAGDAFARMLGALLEEPAEAPGDEGLKDER